MRAYIWDLISERSAPPFQGLDRAIKSRGGSFLNDLSQLPESILRYQRKCLFDIRLREII